jgi:hypothetical protein
MIRYVLTPTVDQNLTPRQHMALLRQCREMDPGDDYQKVAEDMSRLVGVIHVTVTCINEHSVGVWRAGQKT